MQVQDTMRVALVFAVAATCAALDVEVESLGAQQQLQDQVQAQLSQSLASLQVHIFPQRGGAKPLEKRPKPARMCYINFTLYIVKRLY